MDEHVPIVAWANPRDSRVLSQAYIGNFKVRWLTNGTTQIATETEEEWRDVE